MIQTLPEIPEDEATHEVAELYEAIRLETGSPLVNYIWRHLATIDGAAHWAWDFLSINDSSLLEHDIEEQANLAAVMTAKAMSLDTSLTLSNDSWAILNAYNRNNVANLARVLLLMEGVCALPGSYKTSYTPPAVKLKERKLRKLPSLPSFSDVTQADLELILRLTLAGPASCSGIVPSLWRHLTIQKGLISQLCYPLEMTLSSREFHNNFSNLRNQAIRAAESQPIGTIRPIDFNRETAFEGLERFSHVIAELTIAGRIIEHWAR
ncbi:hypothetical protein MHM84_20920 [Halomonas sp. McH1-25]|uniref:hypothetical protein n=1 Tax=unclassified Halomonas TaxID=2609666 RepID=UPI001EF5449E|nr:MULTISPECIES: hypothetical protein [unclassified Halomonas]MCG7602200.1 hypothetical protein [Halomonas sp. McH1-25]MCP1344471.1 hypothetical protein [Halomonas sp. FL8]MCP1362792.1 hypothetical protein [Halomonas sp. BBD45]MCP1363713.1 hypothetical protein [Halomonas sp. BBD48]